MTWIRPYTDEWPASFRRIARYLESAVPDGARVHHVGSTSIRGMPAKDIIDVDIECRPGESARVIASLAKQGYLHEGDKGIAGREAMLALPNTGAAELPPHHLYVCESGARELQRHLAYRDYLIAHPQRAAWLADCKISCDRHASDRDDYIACKAEFYAFVVAEAEAWQRSRQS